jgi:hypothetical protein
VPQRQLVGRLAGEVDPPDPVGPAVGDDLDRPVAVADDEPAADHAAGRRTRPGRRAAAELIEQVEDPLLAGGCVHLLGEQDVELGVGLEERASRRPGAEVERPRPLEQVLDVERRDPHRHTLAEMRRARLTVAYDGTWVPRLRAQPGRAHRAR